VRVAAATGQQPGTGDDERARAHARHHGTAIGEGADEGERGLVVRLEPTTDAGGAIVVLAAGAPRDHQGVERRTRVVPVRGVQHQPVPGGHRARDLGHQDLLDRPERRKPPAGRRRGPQHLGGTDRIERLDAVEEQHPDPPRWLGGPRPDGGVGPSVSRGGRWVIGGHQALLVSMARGRAKWRR
jgi:hypothetical protein